MGQHASSSLSYVGNNDPGLFITSVSLGSVRHDWEPLHHNSIGYGGFGWWWSQTPKTVKALCRMKGSGNSRVHNVYIIDDIDPCGNMQASVDVDMSVGNVGDWICADLPAAWTGAGFTSYNILSSEDNNGDGWYWEDTQVLSYHAEWTYTGISWTTWADPACTTRAGNMGTGREWGPVNFIISNP